ncbi:MAG: phosphoribosylanthranilate isomerase [Fibrobacterota bacterium]
MKECLVKVCGTARPDNIAALSRCDIDMIGAVFYPKSSRFAPAVEGSAQAFCALPNHITAVGVFVNASREEILRRRDEYDLQAFQLHGNESPDQCRNLRREGQVFKAFGIDDSFDFSRLKAYEDTVDLFVFDTATAAYGGSGQQFCWEILAGYTGCIPFLLSGGIGPRDASAVAAIDHSRCIGVDVNSRFETAPAQKNIQEIKRFTARVKDRL